MPQMFPISWLLMMNMIFLIVMLFFSLIYFSSGEFLKGNKNKPYGMIFFWKW